MKELMRIKTRRIKLLILTLFKSYVFLYKDENGHEKKKKFSACEPNMVRH